MKTIILDYTDKAEAILKSQPTMSDVHVPSTSWGSPERKPRKGDKIKIETPHHISTATIVGVVKERVEELNGEEMYFALLASGEDEMEMTAIDMLSLSNKATPDTKTDGLWLLYSQGMAEQEAISKGAILDDAAMQTNTDPTDAQKESGNYKKGHAVVRGLSVTIENPKGSVRSGVSVDGKKWESKMQHHYGYFLRTEGSDGDHVDVFLTGRAEEELPVFVIDQIDPRTGEFDEHKVVMGANDIEDARSVYLSNYEEGWKGLGAIHEMDLDTFKIWLMEGDTTVPCGGQECLQSKQAVKKEDTSFATGTKTTARLTFGELQGAISVIDEIVEAFPVCVLPELDGVRVVVIKTAENVLVATPNNLEDNLLSRIPALRAPLMAMLGVKGESVGIDVMFEADLSIERDGKRLGRSYVMKRLAKNSTIEDWPSDEYPVLHIYDLISMTGNFKVTQDMPYVGRMEQLKAYCESLNDQEQSTYRRAVRVLESLHTGNKDELMMCIASLFNVGYGAEGAYIVPQYATYPDSVENAYKILQSVDVRVVASRIKRYENGTVSILCSVENRDGGVTDLGWTTPQAIEGLQEGDVVTVNALRLIIKEDRTLGLYSALVKGVGQSGVGPMTLDAVVDEMARAGLLSDGSESTVAFLATTQVQL